MSKIKVTYINSAIDRKYDQKATIKALGFTKLNQTVEHEDTPQIMGMIRKVQHLLNVQK